MLAFLLISIRFWSTGLAQFLPVVSPAISQCCYVCSSAVREVTNLMSDNSLHEELS